MVTFTAIAPSPYFRMGDGADEAIAAKARAAGGMPHGQVSGDMIARATFRRARSHTNPLKV
jgi:hypothetical protein